MPESTSAAARLGHLLYDNDGWNLFGNLGPDWRRAVNRAVQICAPEVSTYLVCVKNGKTFYTSAVEQVVPRATDLVAAIDAGEDPFGEFLQQLRATGRTTMLTLRMNDVHNPTEAWNIPRVREQHPDAVVGSAGMEQHGGGWMSYCLDYARPEVRQYTLALIAEQIERYGAHLDGFSLDWLRFPRHLAGSPAEVWAQRDILTGFMAEVRALTAQAPRPLLLTARTPAQLAGCRQLGLDIGAWARDGLVDALIPASFISTDFAMPLDELQAEMGDQAVPLYGGIDFNHASGAHCQESLRAAALGLYDSGAVGIYLFNFFCWTERGLIGAEPTHWLAGLDQPVAVARKPLLFSVTHRRSRVEGIDLPPALPVTLAPGASAELPLPLPVAALPAARAAAIVTSGGVDVELSVNGTAAWERVRFHRTSLFPQHVREPKKTWLPVDDDCRVFDLPADALRPGANQLTVRNRGEAEAVIDGVQVGLW